MTRRTLDQWKGMVPGVVMGGSSAQIMCCLQDAKADIETLARKAASEAADAARYRWLRDNGHIAPFKRGEEVDAMVDAEMTKPVSTELPF